MSKVENGNTIKVHYRGTLNDGTEFDNSRTRGDTFSFQVGAGSVISGFDSGVVGMTPGEVKTVVITPEDGYGDRVDEAVQSVPRESFPPDFEFVVGATVQGQRPDGQPFLAKICESSETSVVLDFNHPLAGQDLNFEIELVEVL
jgi:peptidylprolyl isomerase